MNQENTIALNLPTYTKEEEVFHVASHSIGIIIGIIMIVLTIINYQSTEELVSGLIFGLALVFLYTISTTYHGVSPEGRGLEKKRIMQIADHNSVPILIVGTIAPLALCLLEPAKDGFGWIVLGVAGGISLVVMILNSVDLRKFKVFTTIGYFIIGGCILFGGEIIFYSLATDGFILLASGAAAYILGALFYGFGGKSKNFEKFGITKQKWMHAVFHALCIVGSVLHCVCIYMYVFGGH